MYALPMGVDFVNEPDLLATPEYAAQSAAWFFDYCGANKVADGLSDKDEYTTFSKITKLINGGYNGLASRWKMYQTAKEHIV